MTDRKTVQVNHALSGVHGLQAKQSAQRFTECRRQIFKRLERKKKLASVIQDQLYGYLQKNPEEKEGLHNIQTTKKRKNKNLPNSEEDSIAVTKTSLYKTPAVQTVIKPYLTKNGPISGHAVEERFKKWFQFSIFSAQKGLKLQNSSCEEE